MLQLVGMPPPTGHSFVTGAWAWYEAFPAKEGEQRSQERAPRGSTIIRCGQLYILCFSRWRQKTVGKGFASDGLQDASTHEPCAS